MSKEVHTHLPERYRPAALDLYLGALDDIFYPILGRDGRAHKAMIGTIDPTSCLVAINEGKVVGILGMGTTDGSFLNPKLASMMAAYGLLGGLYRLAGLMALNHPSQPHELYVDGIAVSESMRSRGIGSQLFKMLEIVGMKNGFRTITLEVVNTNPKARSLYDRLGFIPTKHQKIWPLNLFFKFEFQSTTFMVKSLQ